MQCNCKLILFLVYAETTVILYIILRSSDPIVTSVIVHANNSPKTDTPNHLTLGHNGMRLVLWSILVHFV